MAEIKSDFLKGKKILVVEDDAPLRNIICSVFDSDGAEVRFAENGLVAKTILDLNQGKFDLIISDVRMPEMDGIALLKYAKSAYPDIVFFIFTGFSEIIEAQQAYDMGANGFLMKPFRLVELRKALYKVLNPEPAKEAEPEAMVTFCKIHVDEFLTSSSLPSDIYVQVAAEKYVKVAHEGTAVEIQRIHTYKEKKVIYFYVLAEDFHKYTGLSLKVAKAANGSTKITPEQKMKIFKHTNEVLLQQIFVNGLEPNLCEETENLISNTIKMLSENADLFNVVMVMQGSGDKIFTHSVAVSAYATMIAKKIGWISVQNLYKLSLAGFFHDLGLREIPSELHNKARLMMTPAEIKLYETHPSRARELLVSIQGFPGDLAQIIYQHHENQAGTGYPQGLSGQKIHPLASVLRIADEFADRLSVLEKPTLGDAQEIVKALYVGRGDEFEPEFLGALFAVVNLERPVELLKKRAG